MTVCSIYKTRSGLASVIGADWVIGTRCHLWLLEHSTSLVWDVEDGRMFLFVCPLCLRRTSFNYSFHLLKDKFIVCCEKFIFLFPYFVTFPYLATNNFCICVFYTILTLLLIIKTFCNCITACICFNHHHSRSKLLRFHSLSCSPTSIIISVI